MQPDEQAIVAASSASRTTPTEPGLNYHLPSPIGDVVAPERARVNRIEIGSAAQPSAAGSGRGRATCRGSADADRRREHRRHQLHRALEDQGRAEYLFNIRDPEETVKAAAESAMREIIGQTQIAERTTEGRGKIEQDTQDCCSASSTTTAPGVSITQVQLQQVDPPEEVIDAFRDVQRAQADQRAAHNEAEAYRNESCRAPRRGRSHHPGGRGLQGARSSPAPRATPSASSRSTTIRQGPGRDRASASTSRRWKRS